MDNWGFVIKKSSSRFSFLNIGVIAVIVGILIYLFQIELLYFIDKSITSFGLMTIPLSMLIIGGILSKIKLRDLFKSKSIYLLSLLRLLLIPLVVLGFLYLLEIDKIIISVSVLVIAMPVAITLPVLTQRYNGDTDFATKTVIISTFLSILTTPIIVIILNKIY
ncbi:MAG: AEC family transporter [Bacilli bacterium]